MQLNITDSSTAGLVLPNGDVLPFRGGYEAVDGSGWRILITNGRYEVHQPAQILKFSGGKLVEIDHRDGSATTLQYDSTGRLTTAMHSSGRSATFAYGTSSYAEKERLIAIKSDGIALVEYSYDSAGRLEFARYPNATVRRYHYEDPAYPNHLTGITDETDQRYATYAYNANGWVMLSEHAGGMFRGTASYQPDGTTIFTDPNGRNQTFQFTSDGTYRKVTNVSDPSGTQSIIYGLQSADFRRRPTSRTDKRGVISSYVYSDYTDGTLGSVRLTTTNEAVGTPQARTTQEWRRLDNGWLLKQVVPNRETTYARNPRGQVLTLTERDLATGTSRMTSTTFCEQADIDAGICPLLGLIKSVNGPRTDVSDITTFTYYPSDEPNCASSLNGCSYRKGDVWKTTNALNQVIETLKYDGAGRVLSVRDANGVITDLEYHPRGWLTARKVRGANAAVETDDQITRIEYWSTGLVKKVTQPDNAFTAYTYDAAHRLTDISDNAGNTIHYTLDNAGNKTQEDTKDVQGTLRRTLSRVYNQLGQLQTQKDAFQQPTGFTYDANGNTNTVTDALTRVTDNDYDPLNRLSRTLQDVGGINAQTSFQYDALDNLTQVTDPKGLNTGYSYNGLGDLLQLSSPDTGTTTYTYDSGGNRKTQVDARSKTATYSYDVLNRLTGIAYPVTTLNVTYTYDTSQTVCATGETFSKGRLTKLQDASGTTQYCFDRFGNLVRKVQTTNAKVFTLRYAYTPGGRLQSVTYPNGASVDYVRDTQGQVSQVGITPAGATRQVLLSQATYAPFGPATGWTYGNGRTLQRTLNQNYQPNVIIDAAPGGLSLGYAFDPVGNLATLRTAQQTDPPLATYGYDALSRLSDVRDGPTGTVIEHYAYDATGNRQSVTNAGTTTAYTYYPANTHRLSAVGSVARSYDAVGNTTQIGGTARQFVYNDAGRMSQVKAGSTVTMNYVTNGRGEQVRKYLGTTNTYTVYDEAGHWLGDYDSTGAPLQQAIWLDDMPVGVLVGASTSQKLHYLEPDHLGTPRVVIDPVRNVAVWKWELKGEAFGNTVPNQNPDADGSQFVFRMRFPGQRYDATSGLNYNYFRDYDAVTGRYVESDPVGHLGGINTYAYALSNPLMWFDQNGQAAGTVAQPQPYPGSRAPTYGPRLISPWQAVKPLVGLCAAHPVVLGVMLLMIPNTTTACDTIQDRPSNCPALSVRDDYAGCVSVCSAAAQLGATMCEIKYPNGGRDYDRCAAAVIANFELCIAQCGVKHGIE